MLIDYKESDILKLKEIVFKMRKD